MGIPLSLSRLFLNPFNRRVTLSGVYLEDQKGDTLVYVGNLNVKLRRVRFSPLSLTIKDLELDSANIRLVADSAGVFNYQFLIPESTDSTDVDDEPAKYDIEIADLNIRNVNFTYQTAADTAQPYALNFENLRFRDINLAAHNIIVNDHNTTVLVRLDSLSLSEHCGLEVKKLASKVDFSTRGLKLENMQLVCPETNLSADSIYLHYNGFDSFGDFLNQVTLGVNVSPGSYVGLNDVGHIVPDVYGYDISPGINTRLYGPVSNLRIKDFAASYGNSTRVAFNGLLKGLPDVDKLYFDINLQQFITSQQDLVSIHEPFDSIPLIPLPDFLNDLGVLNLTAQTKGSINNLSLQSNLESKLGNVLADISMKTIDNSRLVNGFLDASKLNLGAISGDSQTLGLLSTHDSINVRINDDGSLVGKIRGGVDSVGLMGYYYKNIAINGDFTDKSFDGILSIKDRCMDLDFEGLVDFGKVNKFNFELSLNHADLARSNIMQDSVADVRLGLMADFQASSIDDINGVVLLSKPLVFNLNDKSLVLNNLKLNAIIDHYLCSMPERTITINSDFLDAQLSGRVLSSQVAPILNNFVYMIFPSLDYSNSKSLIRTLPKLKRPTKIDFDDPDFVEFFGNKFDFNLVFKNINRITDFIMPEVSIANNTTIEGGFHTLRKRSWINLKSRSVDYGDYSLDSLNIYACVHDTIFDFDFKCDSVLVGNDVNIKNPHFNIFAHTDTARYYFEWNNYDSLDVERNDGSVTGSFIFHPHEQPNHFPLMINNFHNTFFYIFGKRWDINSSTVTIDSSAIAIDNFVLRNSKQLLAVNGKISSDINDRLELELQDFDLSIINNLLDGATIEGLATGRTSVANIYGSLPLVETNNRIDTLKVNGVVLGPFTSDIIFQPQDSLLLVDFFTLSKMNKKNLHGYGNVDLKSSELDFTFDIGNLSSKVLRPLYQNYLTVPSTQFLDGITRIKGKFDNPVILSELKLKGGYFKIDYLGVKYTIQDALNIVIDNNLIQLQKVKLLSGKTGVAYLEGDIKHHNFDKFDMTMNLQLKNFTLLDAKETDSSAFWGKAFASGNVSIKGDPTRMINIDANVKTDKNTQVSLPLYGASDISADFQFITFKNPNDTLSNELHRQKADLSDIRMNFNLEVTPDAMVEAILDPSPNNYLKASASGNLKLDITGSGDFNMFGTLAMERGEFMISKGLSKKFEVVKGGTLRWRGDPLDAEVDLSACYRLRKVNLYNLMVDDQYRDKKVPVQCLLKMRGNIMQPEISFGVNVEENSGVVQGQIDNLDEGNINKQMVSLLLLNQFQPLPGLKSSEGSVFSDINPGELVSNQLNHWLSNVSDHFELSVNYQMSDLGASDELDLEVSRQLFNDRVKVTTNLGVGGDNPSQANTRQSSVVGEVEVDVNLNKTGTVTLNAYNKANNDELSEAPYKQGVGITFRRDFDSFREVWQSLFHRRRHAEQ
ncbi:MAG: translocation/assembly module TamB domain-containing protein [Bacteroidales bacterium]|nr:translocation/assembly module TamB domain-containing protein [Bacteroidales bacterium]